MNTDERKDDDVLTPFRIDKEVVEEETLRPRTLDDFTGQSRIRENLRIFI